MIKRIPGSMPTRAKTVVHNGLVYTVTTAPNKSAPLYEQTREALAIIDRNLAEAGSDKSRILTATVLHHRHEQEGGDEPRLGRMGRQGQPAAARLHRRGAGGPGPGGDPGHGGAVAAHPLSPFFQGRGLG